MQNIKNEKLATRLKKISGQVSGIEKMLNDGKDCEAIIQQIVAVRSALASLGIEVILESNAQCKVSKTKPEDLKHYLTNIFKLT